LLTNRGRGKKERRKNERWVERPPVGRTSNTYYESAPLIRTQRSGNSGQQSMGKKGGLWEKKEVSMPGKGEIKATARHSTLKMVQREGVTVLRMHCREGHKNSKKKKQKKKKKKKHTDNLTKTLRHNTIGAREDKNPSLKTKNQTNSRQRRTGHHSKVPGTQYTGQARQGGRRQRVRR